MNKHIAVVEQDVEPVEHSSIIHDPVLWIAVSFVIFLGLFMRYVWPLMAKGLDDRSAQIRDQLEQATRLRAEAEELLATYRREQEEKALEAEAIIHTAMADADALRARAATELAAALERRGQQALDVIKRAEEDATRQIRTQMIETATQAAGVLVRDALEKGDQEDPAITRALGAIERQIH